MKVFTDDRVLYTGEIVISVHTREEAHKIVRLLFNSGEFPLWRDHHYFVRVDGRYFLTSIS